ncbi:hypothetical protein ACTFIW_003470 [Dictyostelium discoideum]
MKWLKENLKGDILESDIIAGDFNVNNKIKKSKMNIFIKNTLKEAGLSEIYSKEGVTFPRDNSNLDRIFISKKIAHMNPELSITKINETTKNHQAANIINNYIEIKLTSKNSISKRQTRKLTKEEAQNKLTNQTNTFINNKETPSKYLTRKLKIQKKNNEIHQILDKNNILVNDNESIVETARIYYEKLYEEKECDEYTHHELLKSFSKTINSEILQKIDKPITEEEIRLCVEKLQEGKAPGLDGLIPTFYKNHINQLLPLLIPLYNHFWNDSIPKSFKQGMIIILYKNKGDANHLDNYRPITLLNVDYKIYSKIINNRILSFLGDIISPYQSGFVPNRLLHDNIITLNTTIERINRELKTNKQISPIITFYDLEKAFDSISHKSILRTLAHLKLPFKLIITIMNLLKESETTIYINNYISKPFISKRGTKKGDPISPTIFALVVECMATSIMAERTIKGINAIKLLQFADDTSTIGGNFIDHLMMDNMIKRFCRATSAKINTNKCSCITFRENTNTIYSKSHSSERYLGFNFTNKGIESKTLEIAEKVKTQLSSWKTTSSTYQGRMILAKTYGLSQLTFHTYINNVTPISNIEDSISKFVFNTRTKNVMRKERREASFTNGGLNLWNMNMRETAQMAWLYERYLHQRKNEKPSSFVNIWSNEEKIGMNVNPSAPNFYGSATTIHKQCHNAWKKLKTNTNKITHYEKLPKLKKIYNDLMRIKDPNFDTFKPTPGQKDILRDLNRKTLPFKEVKKIANIKGRDLLWRYLLKALPKPFNKECALCGEIETSKHIFFVKVLGTNLSNPNPIFINLYQSLLFMV